MKYALLIDVNRCSICFACEVACKDEFVGNAYPPYSATQPDVEQEWIKLQEFEKGKYPYVKVYPIPLLCMHCENPPCIKACPVPGAIYKTEDSVVIIDPKKCDTGECSTKPCVKGCPWGVIFFNEESNISQKCTLCIHRLKEGQEPACFDACPSGVFLFGEESEILKEVKKRGARPMNPEYEAGPRVYYIGLPSVTLAGHIIGEQSLMDIPDAKVAITEKKSGSAVSCKSDISGNFVFENLKAGATYSVDVQCRGYKPKTIGNVKLDIEYKHLGDLKLAKATKK
ncbi:MAG: carboxypeptidase regulatory-like domain-containing protein [Dehalococcoidia bacterium]|nr:carboxypeptidase regulatory-like domain-containing protein [Dehalococcoidia bacterium]